MSTKPTCKKTCIIAVGLPPPNLDILNIVNSTRIKKGRAKHNLRCQGEPAVNAFCRHRIHRILYEMIVNHFRNPPKQNTLAVTNGRAPVTRRHKKFQIDINYRQKVGLRISSAKNFSLLVSGIERSFQIYISKTPRRDEHKFSSAK